MVEHPPRSGKVLGSIPGLVTLFQDHSIITISESNIANDEKQIGDAEVEADKLENAEDDWEADSDEVELEDDGSSDEARLSFLLGFIKTFVVHLTAKRALERYSFKIKDRAAVNISLLSVE